MKDLLGLGMARTEGAVKLEVLGMEEESVPQSKQNILDKKNQTTPESEG